MSFSKNHRKVCIFLLKVSILIVPLLNSGKRVSFIMATVTVSSHFVSRTSLFNNHGASSCSDLSQITLKGPSMTHCGLRSFNMVDKLQRRSQAKPVSAKSSKGSSKVKTGGKIVCEKGMSVIFIGAEVGPWSKTGGLGDVLGGLPPALAVSSYTH